MHTGVSFVLRDARQRGGQGAATPRRRSGCRSARAAPFEIRLREAAGWRPTGHAFGCRGVGQWRVGAISNRTGRACRGAGRTCCGTWRTRWGTRPTLIARGVRSGARAGALGIGGAGAACTACAAGTAATCTATGLGPSRTAAECEGEEGWNNHLAHERDLLCCVARESTRPASSGSGLPGSVGGLPRMCRSVVLKAGVIGSCPIWRERRAGRAMSIVRGTPCLS